MGRQAAQAGRPGACASGAPGPAGARRAHPARGPAPRPHRQPDRPRGRLARRGLGRGRARPLRHRGRLQPRRGEAVPAGAAVGVSSGSAHVNEGGMGPSPDDLALLAARRARIMEKMGGGVMLLAAAPERPRTADILYPYRQDSDFAYVTGFPEPEAVCVLAPDAPERFVLFVRPRDPEREQWVGARAGVEGAVERYGANAAFKLEELEQVLPRLLEKAPQVWHTVRRDDPLVQRLMALIRRAQEMQPRTGTGPTTIRDPGDLLHEMRLRKEPAELARRDLYEAVLAAQLAAIAAVGPGTTLEAVHKTALRVLAEALIAHRVLTGTVDEVLEKETYKRFYMHRTSHWLGRDVHDVGRYAEDGTPRALEPGMVLTVEPGLYIPAGAEDVPAPYRGVGIRIEDDVLVTEAGREVLSAAAPKQVAEVEALRAEAS